MAFLGVTLLHAIFYLVLVRAPRSALATRIETKNQVVTALLRMFSPPGLGDRPSIETHLPNAPPRKHQSQTNPSIHTHAALAAHDHGILLPPLDWGHEAEVAARNQINAADKEKSYRNLSGLSEAQLEWINEHHLQFVASNPPWTLTRAGHIEDGMLWINDHCAMVGPMLFCAIALGKKESRGDLFKGMRQYLDKRVTDPLP